MTDERAFIQRIRENPRDVVSWLVFADWLEEQGDGRCQVLRRDCQSWAPIARADLQRLEAVEQSRREAGQELVVWGFDPERTDRMATAPSRARPGETTCFGLYEASLAALKDDLAHLSRTRIARAFPREDDGRLPLKCDIPLAVYGCLAHGGGDPSAAKPRLWLTASSPQLRRDPQMITISLKPLIGRNQPYDWSRARWRWDSRVAPSANASPESPPERVVRLMNLDDRRENLERLLAVRDEGRLGDWPRKALTVLMQDEARFVEAFDLWGLDLALSLQEAFFGPSDLPLREQLGMRVWRSEPVDLWKPALRRLLWEAAPWKLAEMVQKEFEDRQTSTHHITRLIVLAPLPTRRGQRRVWLQLHMPYREEERAKLHLGTSTRSPACAPVTAWKRPIEWDLARLGWEPDRSA